tara:strand:- start:110 stop:316 length:207 start_codon:yes stop_codon:yes gene_type:complete
MSVEKDLKEKTLNLVELSRDLVDIVHENSHENHDKISKEIIDRINKDLENYDLDELNKINHILDRVND